MAAAQWNPPPTHTPCCHVPAHISMRYSWLSTAGAAEYRDIESYFNMSIFHHSKRKSRKRPRASTCSVAPSSIHKRPLLAAAGAGFCLVSAATWLYVVERFHGHLVKEQIQLIKIPETNGGHASSHQAFSKGHGSIGTRRQKRRTYNSSVIKPYNRHTVLATQRHFSPPNLLLVYEPPPTDLVKVYHSPTPNIERNSTQGVVYNNVVPLHATMVTVVARALRNIMTVRGAKSKGFQLLLAGRDMPDASGCWQLHDSLSPNDSTVHVTPTKTREECLPSNLAPIIFFGSVPQDKATLPSVHVMPLMTYLGCLFDRSKCVKIPEEQKDKSLFQLEWDGLTSQLVWRGSGFAFLEHSGLSYSLGSATNYLKADANDDGSNAKKDDKDQLDPNTMSREEVATFLMNKWDELTPRWRCVALSLQAAIEADNAENNQTQSIPWIDAKFLIDVDPKTASGFDKLLHPFINTGSLVGTSLRLSAADLSKCKYHLCLGGGGGTSWTCVLDKLAMPGVLFHHNTLTKDWFYDDMQEWKEYIPLRMDLTDLREKFEWAEQHPDEVKKIAQAGTEFVRNLIRADHSKEIYRKYFVETLSEVLEAYGPEEGERDVSSAAQIIKLYGDEGISLELMSTCDRQMCEHQVYEGKYGRQSFFERSITPRWLWKMTT